MKTLGVIVNSPKPRAAEVTALIVQFAARHGLRLLADEGTARLVRSCPSCPMDSMLDQADALMVVGGDGTMLRAVRALNGRDKPVIGVNIGGLGFLTSVAEEDLERALRCLAADDYVVSVRSLAECLVEREGRETARDWALNDVVITRGPSARIVTLDVCVGEEKVTSYVCDGLIVSTPTGSTGHSLSAGGPILTPQTPAFVMSLICPHTLSSRPLVLPDHVEIVITAPKTTEPLVLSVDGRAGQTVDSADRVRVRRSGRSVRFIHLPGYSYFAVLRQKLHWSGSSV